LNSTKVTDAGLREIAGLKSIQSLELTQTAITDEGLQSLGALPKLNCLKLYGAKTTEKGRAKLQSALPKLRIFWSENDR